MIYSIYRLTNLLNGKKYIGMTKRDCELRLQEHIHEGIRGVSQFPIHQAIRKYGEGNFLFEVLLQTKQRKHIKQLEIDMIVENKSHITQHGYNKTWGGDGATFFGKAGAVVAETGERLGLIDCDDPRWKTGEIISCRVGVKDSYTPQSFIDFAKSRTGSKNSNAKHYHLISPEGIIYEIHGNCQKVVKELGLKYSALYDYIDKGIPVPPVSKFHKKNMSKERENTIGWMLVKIKPQ